MAQRFRSLAMLVVGVTVGVGTTLLVHPGAGGAQAPTPPPAQNPNVPSNMGPRPAGAAPVQAPPLSSLTPPPHGNPLRPSPHFTPPEGHKDDTLPVHIKNCVDPNCYNESHSLATDGDPGDTKNVLSNMSVNGGGSVATAQVTVNRAGRTTLVTLNAIAVTMPKQAPPNEGPAHQQTLYVWADPKNQKNVVAVAVACRITSRPVVPCALPMMDERRVTTRMPSRLRGDGPSAALRDAGEDRVPRSARR